MAPFYGSGTPTYGETYVFAGRVLNRIKPAQQFLRQLFFPQSRERLLFTEEVEFASVRSGRVMAPMSRPGTPARPVKGVKYVWERQSAPHIGISRKIEARDALFTRRPGAGIHHTGTSEMNAARREYLGHEYEKLSRMIENREEWMTAAMMKKQLEYTDEAGDAFEVNYPVDPELAAYTLAVGGRWDNYSLNGATGLWNQQELQNTDPRLVARDLDRIMSSVDGFTSDVVVCGQEAAEAFETHPLVHKQLDTNNVQIGRINLENTFNQEGARYIGRYAGKDWWEYSRKIQDGDGGAEVDLIEPKFAYFASTSASAEREFLYGAITNLHLLLGKKADYSLNDLMSMAPRPIRRFGDIQVSQDGSNISAASYTRPVPSHRMPDTIHGLQVVS